MKAPVDRNKQHRYLKFGTWGLYRSANEYLSPFYKISKTTSGFVEKTLTGAKRQHYIVPIDEFCAKHKIWSDEFFARSAKNSSMTKYVLIHKKEYQVGLPNWW